MEKQGNAAFEAPTTEQAQAFLTNAEQGPANVVRGPGASTIVRQESAQTVLHDTCVGDQNSVVLHRSFLAK